MSSSSLKEIEFSICVERKEIDKVKKILKDYKGKKAKALLSFVNNAGETPLMIALRNNHLEGVEVILQSYRDSKIDINSQDKTGYTILHQAVSSDEKVLMKVLMHENINVDLCNDDKNTPLHYFCEKFKSPQCQEPFQLFLERHVNVNAQNKNGETPLHKAIFNRFVRLMMVNQLLEAGANVNLLNNYHESPLHYAVRLGRDDLVSVLLRAGADFTIVGRAPEKKTPLELASAEGETEMAKLITKYKDLYDWLQENNLDQYKESFVKEEMFKDVLGDMTERILDKMGITAAGHRLRILKYASQQQEIKPKTLSKIDILNEDGNSVPPEAADVNSLIDSLRQLQHIGEFNIIKDIDLEYTEKLGAGSSGKVYKGLYSRKEVAIKVLKAMTDKEVDEFKKEFQIMSAIRSKYVVYFYGAVLDPKLCMVMEHCSRGSLYHVMNNDKYDIGWDKTFRFAIEMVRGIECLHNWTPQIVHRDLKSLNLLVNDKWEVKVCDFGLSRFNTGSNLETLAKMRGTFAYCPPEIYFNQQFSIKSDVYSIGVILWELVTRCLHGRYERPYSEYKNLQHDFQIIIQTAKKNLRPTIPAACPQNFVNLIKQCWDPAHEQRPNCTEVIKTLLTLENEYRSNSAVWDSAIKYLPKEVEDDD